MRTRNKIKYALKHMTMSVNKRSSISVLLSAMALILFFTVMPALVQAATMQNYCVVPPYVTSEVAPNIMILMDNSSDMYTPAYSDEYTPNATKDNYNGYFKPQACYEYSGGVFKEVARTGSISCTSANCYTSYTATDTCPSSAPFRGNLLNWATTSKYDLLQKVLIGGNAVSRQLNANTLLSIGGAWQKIFSGCVFNVSNANLTITEANAGECALLDSPVPAAWLNIVFLDQRRQHALAARMGNWIESITSYMSAGANGVAVLAGKVWELLDPVSEAWAATGVGIQSGSLTGILGSPYSITFGCTGGGSDCPNATYNWTITNKPAWLTTTTYATSGSKINYQVTLSGYPLVTGNYGPFTVSLTAGTKSASSSFTISIGGGPLGIISGSLPDGQVGASYSTTVTGKGGVTCGAVTNPYTWVYQWSATGLPAGLSMNGSTGVISGIPSGTAGTYNVTITMMDCSTPQGSISKTLPLVISASSLAITTTVLPEGLVSSSYTATLAGLGGTNSGYTWAITSGYLPFGLSLNPSTGAISGKTCPFTSSGAVTGQPGLGTGTGPGIRTIGSDGVNPVNYLTTDSFSVIGGHSYKVSSCPADGGSYTGDTFLQLTGAYEYYNDDYYDSVSATYPCGTGSRIDFTASFSGIETVKQSTYGSHTVGTGAYPDDTTWSYNIIDTTDNRACQGTFPFTIRLTDSVGTTVTRNLSITIYSGGLRIASTSLAQAAKNQPYSYTVQGAGGTAPYTWSATGLPTGFAIDPATGVISGTAAANQVGAYTVTVTLTDSAGTTVTKNLAFSIVHSIAIRSASYNIKVDIVEETLTDLNGNNIYDVNTGETFVDFNGDSDWNGKKGVFQQYWDANNPKARWGLTDYTSQGVQVEACIPASPASSFYTAIQNATPETSAPLANGLYGDINYYGFSSAYFPPYNSASYRGCGNSDPIDLINCRKNFVMIISSGSNLSGSAFTANPDLTSFPSSTSFSIGVEEAGKCTISSATYNTHPLVKNACYGFLNDMRSDKVKKQQVFTYAVFIGGTATSLEIMRDAASAGGGKFYDASDDLEGQLNNAFKDMLARASSGTAASVLASGEGSGANLVQAVFYPRKKFGTDEIDWIGRLTNLWYYVDPRFANSTIREDDGDKILTLMTAPTATTHTDYITTLEFDGEKTVATRATDTNGDGVPDGAPDPAQILFEQLGNLWEAGTLLWKRDLTASPRRIYTSTTGNFNSQISFSTANAGTLAPLMNVGGDSAVAANVIRYVHGEDIAGFRPRTVKIDLNGDGDLLDTVDGYSESVGRVYKLGDVLNSTPRISTWQPLNGYHKLNKDSSYGVPGEDPLQSALSDPNHYITSAGYKGRNIIYTGANDGMLHAFRLGTLELSWSGQNAQYEKARMTGSGLGEEVWAYVPKNVLPYLTYTTDLGYCHLYSVDLSPFIFDASIGSPASGEDANSSKTPASWRTILIGGMRYGGSCKPVNATCSTTTPNGVCAPDATGGYSSYFALDITDQDNPILLWERSSTELSGLGFSTAGPAVVRINAAGDSGGLTKNGHWFVVLGSGPTGPISAEMQFLGRSDQPLRLFVLNLKDGSLAATIPTSVSEAFAGSMYNSTMDTDNPLDYQDDVVYVPYVKKATDGTWTAGGVGRLSTKEDTVPSNWSWSTVIDNIGPVTSAVTKLQNNTTRTLWLFFGTGRYYFEQSDGMDDPSGQRKIFGAKEPCFSGTFSTSCSSPVSGLRNVTDISNVVTNATDTNYTGWYINLDADYVPSTAFRAERVITDPLATAQGVVFFTSYKPYADQCDLGGESAIWAVKYDTGGSAGTLLQGKALIQVSTGSIEQISLPDAFTGSGGRKTALIRGVPPTAQGLSVLTTPKPVKRVLHMRER